MCAKKSSLITDYPKEKTHQKISANKFPLIIVCPETPHQNNDEKRIIRGCIKKPYVMEPIIVCPKKTSNQKNDEELIFDEINNLLLNQKRNGHKAVSVSYIYNKTKLSFLKIYDTLYKLIELEFIIIVYSSICSVCGFENITNSQHLKIKCTHCSEVYYPLALEEKFRST